jgi:Uma2 family endonuclease
MVVSEDEFQQIALDDPNGRWELDCGRLRRKPKMTFEHNQAARIIGHVLQTQLGLTDYVVAVDSGLIRRSESQFFIPDVMVVPMDAALRLFPEEGMWEVYTDPLPLVVEVWSPSTGRRDIATKVPEYQRRGDLEIWRVHPYQRTVTVWRRQPDGGYSETLYRGGRIEPMALPNVTIDFDEVFSLLRGQAG